MSHNSFWVQRRREAQRVQLALFQFERWRGDFCDANVTTAWATVVMRTWGFMWMVAKATVDLPLGKRHGVLRPGTHQHLRIYDSKMI